MCWAARSTTTGPIRGAASTSIGPTATGSTSPTAPISSPPRKRCGRNGANGRRKNSSATPARNLLPLPLVGRGRGGGREVTHSRRHKRVTSRPPPHPSPQGGRDEKTSELTMPKQKI